jgi:CDP-diacylglycerol--glycerol-3-phosphate 3-phosphatidyltransferase
MNLYSLMHLANSLTISRILLIPFFMLSFRYQRMLPALVIFCVASFTDYLDGKIARRQGITSFGKFMDPLADKLLVGAALICFTRFKGGLIPGWIVLIIMGREFVITTLRLVFVGRYGTVVAASRWGKYKTSSQMTVIIVSLGLLVSHEYRGLLNIELDFMIQVQGPIYFIMYLPLVLTVVSGLEFLYNNRKALYELMRSPDAYTDDDI